MDLRGRRAGSGLGEGREGRSGSRATRRWLPGSRRRWRPRREALGPGGVYDVQAEARRRRTTSSRCGRCVRRWGRGRGSGSTRTRPGTWRRPSASWRELEPLRDRAGRAAGGDAGGGGGAGGERPRSRSPRDESVARSREAERAAALGACALTGIKLSKVGGPEAALEIAEVAARLRLQRPRRPGRDRRRRRRSPQRSPRPPAGRAPAPRPRPRHPAPVRLDDRRGRVRAARRHAAPAPRARPRRRDRRGGAASAPDLA